MNYLKEKIISWFLRTFAYVSTSTDGYSNELFLMIANFIMKAVGKIA